jgi:RHS repeat-associated protein
VVQNYSYQYDLAGNRTTEQIDPTVTGSSYNNLNQLVSQATGGSMAFTGTVSAISTAANPATLTLASQTLASPAQPATIDSSGNWRGTAPVTAAPAAQPNKISLVATDATGKTTTKTISITVSGGTARTLLYDANGNLTNDGNGKTYAFDAADRMTSVTQTVNGVQTVTGFVYDGFSRRVQETQNGTLIKQWVWCGGLQPCEERDASNNVTKRFYGHGEQINGTNYYFTFDHLGSVREMTDSAGNLVARYDFDPYGRRTLVSGTDLADFGFTGFYHDKVTNLDYSRTRPYTADLARWIGQDPLGEDGGINLYQYCDNNPVNEVDPTGEVAGVDDAAEFTTAELIFAGAAAFGAYEAYQHQRESELALQDFLNRMEARKEATDAPKSCPNPNGKKGGAKHQEVVKEVEQGVKDRGLTPVKELPVETPGGEKGKRFVDVAGQNAEGETVETHQVGKQTQGGNPVAREGRALDDIEKATGQRPTFHPYN